MKKFLAILIVIIVNSSDFCYSQIKDAEKSPYKLIQIITPGSYYHNDGADLIKYPKYEIRDTAGSVIVVVPASINRHHMIEILPGNYLLEIHKPGVKRVSQLVIGEENFQRFQIQKTSQNSD